MLAPEDRVAACIWLLGYGDEAQLFTHLDGALLVDSWPDIAPQLTEGLLGAWQPPS